MKRKILLTIILLILFLFSIFSLIFFFLISSSSDSSDSLTKNILECEFNQLIQEHENLTFCQFPSDTKILAKGYEISQSQKNNSVKMISMFDNKNISFLPVKIDVIFPNLEIYYAYNCAIEEIVKENFQNLYHLQQLSLDKNQIMEISSDIFQDLYSLQILTLGQWRKFWFQFKVSN